jgi:hypothetical protein
VDMANFSRTTANYTDFLDQQGALSWPVPVLTYIILRTDIESKYRQLCLLIESLQDHTNYHS